MPEQEIKRLSKDTPLKKLNFWERFMMRMAERKIKNELSDNPELDELIDETLK